MKLQFLKLRRRMLVTVGMAALAALAAPAWADGQRSAVPLSPEYRQECGSCHTPFPPGLLPAASWARLMGDLPHHFGTDASLDAASQRHLAAWLTANAGSGRRTTEPPPQDRITRSAWFTREHREVPAATWKLQSVKNASNCAACHTQADQGDFNERNIRIPR